MIKAPTFLGDSGSSTAEEAELLDLEDLPRNFRGSAPWDSLQVPLRVLGFRVGLIGLGGKDASLT